MAANGFEIYIVLTVSEAKNRERRPVQSRKNTNIIYKNNTMKNETVPPVTGSPEPTLFLYMNILLLEELSALPGIPS